MLKPCGRHSPRICVWRKRGDDSTSGVATVMNHDAQTLSFLHLTLLQFRHYSLIVQKYFGTSYRFLSLMCLLHVLFLFLLSIAMVLFHSHFSFLLYHDLHNLAELADTRGKNMPCTSFHSVLRQLLNTIVLQYLNLQTCVRPRTCLSLYLLQWQH